MDKEFYYDPAPLKKSPENFYDANEPAPFPENGEIYPANISAARSSPEKLYSDPNYFEGKFKDTSGNAACLVWSVLVWAGLMIYLIINCCDVQYYDYDYEYPAIFASLFLTCIGCGIIKHFSGGGEGKFEAYDDKVIFIGHSKKKVIRYRNIVNVNAEHQSLGNRSSDYHTILTIKHKNGKTYKYYDYISFDPDETARDPLGFVEKIENADLMRLSRFISMRIENR